MDRNVFHNVSPRTNSVLTGEPNTYAQALRSVTGNNLNL